MRCNGCGGILHHIATDVSGHQFYQCSTPLTGLQGDGTRSTYFTTCNAVYNSDGDKFKGHIAIQGEKGVRTFRAG